MICAQWPARSQPTVAAVCIRALVPYISCSTLRYETIGVLCDLFLLNLFSCRILPTCRRALVGLQIDECSIVGQHSNPHTNFDRYRTQAMDRKLKQW